MFTMFATVSHSAYAAETCIFQSIQKKVTVSMKNATLEQILSEINKQTGMDYGFQSNGKVDKNQRFSLNVKGVTVEEALTTLLKDSPYDYILEKNRVVIIARQKKVVSLMSISGRVVDEKGNPIPGATVLVQGTTQGVASDADGRYTISARAEDALRVSFIGYKLKWWLLKERKNKHTIESHGREYRRGNRGRFRGTEERERGGSDYHGESRIVKIIQ